MVLGCVSTKNRRTEVVFEPTQKGTEVRSSNEELDLPWMPVRLCQDFEIGTETQFEKSDQTINWSGPLGLLLALPGGTLTIIGTWSILACSGSTSCTSPVSKDWPVFLGVGVPTTLAAILILALGNDTRRQVSEETSRRSNVKRWTKEPIECPPR